MSAGRHGTHVQTTGTETRGSRSMMDGLMVFSLGAEIAALRAELPYKTGDRNSTTLAKEIDFRVLLTVLRAGATLDEHDGDARVSLSLIEGSITIEVAEIRVALSEGDIAVIDADQPWRLRATQESAVLLTLAWPHNRRQRHALNRLPAQRPRR